MKTLLLVLSTALLVAGGAYGRGWLDSSDQDGHPAIAAFEAFYWKLQRNELEAASALVLPGSEAELALTVERAIGPADDAPPAVARGFALDVSLETDGEPPEQPVVYIEGEATVTVDPRGFVTAFGVPELHEVEARLVEDDGAWRVAAYRDLRR